jgi:hypothetical protein
MREVLFLCMLIFLDDLVEYTLVFHHDDLVLIC